jgi:hypothetical protein
MTGYSLAPVDLRFLIRHWGSAYRITGSGGRWRAARRDGLGEVTAQSPAGLLDVIRADYQARPVPRDGTALSAGAGREAEI